MCKCIRRYQFPVNNMDISDMSSGHKEIIIAFPEKKRKKEI